MTHSNHRLGSRASLEHDYVLICRLSKFIPKQRKNYISKYKEIINILKHHSPICLTVRDEKRGRLRYIYGDPLHPMENPLSVEKPNYVTAVFEYKSNLENVLKEIKDANIGLSTVVSGIFDEVFSLCKNISEGPHTVNMSLGIFGQRNLLPESNILEITTMCGHGMVSPHLTQYLIEKVKNNKMPSKEASIILARQCPCGIFNQLRAEKKIQNICKMNTNRDMCHVD